jgi:hypothetical protein
MTVLSLSVRDSRDKRVELGILYDRKGGVRSRSKGMLKPSLEDAGLATILTVWW